MNKIKCSVIVFSFNLLSLTMFAQDIDSLLEQDKYCTPEYPGGFNEYKNYVLDHIKIPDELVVLGAKGGFLAYSLIDRTGNVIYLWKSHTMDDRFEKSVLNVLSKMPKWDIRNDSCEVRPLLYITPILFFVGTNERNITLRGREKYGFEPIPSIEIMNAINNIPMANVKNEITPAIEIKIIKDSLNNSQSINLATQQH